MAVATEPQTDWQELARRLDARPWFHPGWHDAWWRAFGSGEPVVLRVRRDGRLAGVLPLRRDRLGLRGAANWHSPEFGMLAEDAAACAELAAAAFDLRPARLRLPLLARDGTGLDQLRDEAERRGYRVVERVHARSGYVLLDGADLGALSRSHRKDLDRKWRRLDEQGGLTLELVAGAEGLDTALAEGLPLEASGWKRERGTAIVSRPELLRFYTELARWAAGEGFLLLSFLRLGGKPVAFEFMLRDARRVYGLKIGYDPAYSKWSPGALSHLAVWRRLLEDGGCETYELCGNLDEAKLRWTSLARDRVLFQAFAPTPLGLAALAAERYARPVAKRLLRK